MKSKIWLSPPHMGGTELKYIHKILLHRWELILMLLRIIYKIF